MTIKVLKHRTAFKYYETYFQIFFFFSFIKHLSKRARDISTLIFCILDVKASPYFIVNCSKQKCIVFVYVNYLPSHQMLGLPYSFIFDQAWKILLLTVGKKYITNFHKRCILKVKIFLPTVVKNTQQTSIKGIL